MTRPNVSIVIPNYNGSSIIERCIKSISKQQGIKLEIIVVDDFSNDDSILKLRGLKSIYNFSLIQNKRNLGYAASCDKGVAVARYQNLLFLNSDAFFVEVSGLKTLLQCLKNNPDIGCIGTFQVNPDMSTQFTGSQIDIFGNINSTRKNIQQSDTALQECTMTGGACYLMSKSAYKQVGGIDTSYFLYGEELDLMWRIRLYGYKVMTHMSTRLIHLGGQSTGNKYDNSTSSQKIYLRERNALISAYKNYSRTFLLFVIPVKLLSMFGESMIFLVMGKRSVSQSYLDAVSYFLKNRSNYKTVRKTIQKDRIISDWSLVRNGYVSLFNYKLLYVIKNGLPSVKK